MIIGISELTVLNNIGRIIFLIIDLFIYEIKYYYYKRYITILQLFSKIHSENKYYI